MDIFASTVPVGNRDHRRTIYDLIRDGDAGGDETLNNLGYFSPLYGGSVIGNHYHKKMWETYFVLSGESIMFLHDTDKGIDAKIHIRPDQVPFRIVVPPHMAHALKAVTDVTLLIATTGPPVKEDMFPFICT